MLQKWKLIKSEWVLNEKWYKVRKDTVEIEPGKIIDDYYVAVLADVVMVVAITKDNEVVIVRQYKHGVGVRNTNHSYADKLSTPWTPYAKALEFYGKKGHPIYRLSEQQVKETYSKFQHIISCEPSSVVVFADILKPLFTKRDSVVFLNSGKSVLAE